MRLGRPAPQGLDVRGDIPAGTTHSAGRTALELLGVGDHRLTLPRLERAERLVERGRTGKVSPFLVDQFQTKLPELKSLVAAAQGQPVDVPFSRTVGVDAIVPDAIRRTAAALTAGTERPDRLTLEQVTEAQSLLADGSTAGTSDRAGTLKGARAKGEITDDSLAALETFLRTGQGGLLCHGPIQISGKKFSDVYRLPFDPAQGDMRAAIADYESKFADSGYDRVYLRAEGDGALYLALNDHGRISDRVKTGYKSELPKGSERACLLEVVHVHDVPNGFREALAGPWRDTVARLGDGITRALQGKASEGLERAVADAGAAVTGAPATRAQLGDLARLGTAFTGLSAVGTMVCVAELAVPVALGVTGATAVMSGVSVANGARNRFGQSKAPIVHALGLVPTVAHPDI
jgi:hypothetical protein